MLGDLISECKNRPFHAYQNRFRQILAPLSLFTWTLTLVHLRFGALIFSNLHYAVPRALVFMSFQTLREGKPKTLLSKSSEVFVSDYLVSFRICRTKTAWMENCEIWKSYETGICVQEMVNVLLSIYDLPCQASQNALHFFVKWNMATETLVHCVPPAFLFWPHQLVYSQTHWRLQPVHQS